MLSQLVQWIKPLPLPPLLLMLAIDLEEVQDLQLVMLLAQ